MMQLIKLMDGLLETPHQGGYSAGDDIIIKWKNIVDRYAKQLMDLNKLSNEKYSQQ